MEIYELRLVGVLGLMAIGAMGALTGFAMARLKDLAVRADTRSAGSRVVASRQRC